MDIQESDEPNPGFPINELPILMIQSTLKKLKPLDVMKYATCSENCLDNVKSIYYRTPVELNVKLRNNPSVTFELRTEENQDEDFIIISHRDKYWRNDRAMYSCIYGQTIPIVESSRQRNWLDSAKTNKMVTFWEDPQEGFFKMGRLITDAFNIVTIDHILFSNESHEERVRAVEWMKSKGLSTVNSCGIHFEESSNDNAINYILANIQISTELLIDITKASRNAILNIPEDLESLKILSYSKKNPSLRELERMISFNCKTLDFVFSFTLKDIVDFVTKCLDMEYPRLTRFEVETEDGFELHFIAQKIDRPKTGSSLYGFRFERSDGKIVTIQKWDWMNFRLRVDDGTGN